MGLATEMKKLSNDILFSFNQRVKENEELVNDVQNTLDQFQKDHQEMAAILTANAKALRQDLATGEEERLNSYNDLMIGVRNKIAIIKTEVAAIQTSALSMINEFGVERKQMASELDEFFAQVSADRKEEFDALMKGINDDVIDLFKSTDEMLKNFDKEHLDMSVELRSDLSKNMAENVEYTRILLNGFRKRLSEISEENQKMAQQLQKDLAKGEVDRLSVYNNVMKGMRIAIKEISKEVMVLQKASSMLISNYALDRSQGLVEWNKLQDTIAQLKKRRVDKPVIEIATKPEKQDTIFVPVTHDSKVDVIKQNHIQDDPKEETKPVSAVSLEDKVLDYINQHRTGVKISEMEGPLGETRMKLGFIAKVLLEEGKVQKIENVYYPLK